MELNLQVAVLPANILGTFVTAVQEGLASFNALACQHFTFQFCVDALSRVLLTKPEEEPLKTSLRPLLHVSTAVFFKPMDIIQSHNPSVGCSAREPSRSRVTFESSGFYFSEIYVGNTNALKHREPRARSGQFNGIANIHTSKQAVPRFECVTALDLPLQGILNYLQWFCSQPRLNLADTLNQTILLSV